MRQSQLLTASILLGLPLVAGTQVPSTTQQTDPFPVRPGVLVEGQEPKYVAPNTLDRIGRIWAPVMINGKGPFRLVLDTSGNSSAVIPSVAERLGLPIETSNKAKLVGVTGSAVVSRININSMEVGELVLGGGSIPIVPDVFGGAEGVLAPQKFADKRIVVDFRNDQISIVRSNGRAAEPGYARIPVIADRRNLLMFDIRVGGVKTKAILSTGGDRTIGNNALREALLKRAKEGQEESIVGVTLDVAKGQSVAVPPVNVGGLVFKNLRITFADTVIFDQWKLTKEPAMLICMDVVGSLSVLVIDYRMQELHLLARK